MMSDLPANVTRFVDRHGKMRYRFRRKGWKSAFVPGEPGSAEFHRAYAEILAAGPHDAAPIQSRWRPEPYSLDDLFAQWKKTTAWRKKGQRTTYKQGRIVQRFLDRVGTSGKRYGQRPVKSVTVAWLDNIFGSMSETPAAANELRKVLSGMLDCAIRLQWRTDNPARLTEKYRDGEGFHTWTEGEIARYRETHPLGTMARLVLELALNTAGRRCNIATLSRDDIEGGRIITQHAKDGNEASVQMLSTTKAALDALPAAPIRHLITTAFGKPFTVNGLGNKMRKWCDDANLPHCSMHGLRKATSRRVAESGGTDAEGQAVTGHKKAATFASYRAKANRTALADRALSNVAARFDIELQENDGESDV